MIADSTENQSNANVRSKPSGGEASAGSVLVDNAQSTREALANRNAIAGQSDALGPTFVDEIGSLDVIPQFITKTNARELFGLRPGESVAQALARIAEDG